MRSCEFSSTPTPGKTKRITLDGLVFRSASRTILSHSNPALATAEFVTVTFRDQKNGIKMDSRTQRRTSDPVLCPVLRFAAIVQRILKNVPNCSANTPINSIRLGPRTLLISNTYVRRLLRHTCAICGGKSTFGFDPHEIGNRSIRSGAAMALFLQDISTAKIMILGRWSSDAFLVYIRPQVLEWTNNMSRDMIQLDSFFDVAYSPYTSTDDPRLHCRFRPFNGSTSIAPATSQSLTQ
jgi:hypothetical protein